jgi:adenylyltransferase/sulfurtransferase
MDDFDVTVQELKAKLDRGERIELVDVRRADELAVAKLAYTKWIPIVELQDRIGELSKDSETIVYCHSGVRSTRATKMLRDAGFANVKNLEGGIDAWSDEIDASVPKY